MNQLQVDNYQEKSRQIYWIPCELNSLQLGRAYLVDHFDSVAGVNVKALSFSAVNNPAERVVDFPFPPGRHCGIGEEGVTADGIELSSFKTACDELLYSRVKNVLILAGHYLPNTRGYLSRNALSLFAEAIATSRDLSRQGIRSDICIYVNDIHMSTEDRTSYYRDFVLPVEFQKAIQNNPICRLFVASQRKLCDRVLREKKHLIKQGKLFPHEIKNGLAYYLSTGLTPFIVTFSSKRSGAIRCVQACTKVLDIAKLLGYEAVIQYYPVCGRTAVETGLKLARKLYDVQVPVINVYKTRDCFR